MDEKQFLNQFSFSKKWGQNFLIDVNVKERIIKYVRSFLFVNPPLLEIGPGMGALTKELCTTYPLTCVEVDPSLVKYLKSLKLPNLTIINQDCLSSSFNELLTTNTLIYSNTPYSITTAMIRHFIDIWKNNHCIFLMQQEVASKISAFENSSDYGAFSIYVQTFLKIELLFNVSATCFYPTPKVASTLVDLQKNDNELNANLNHEHYWLFLSKSFLMRRKTLINNLKTFCKKETIKAICDYLQIDETSKIRAQELTYLQFIGMFNIYEANH